MNQESFKDKSTNTKNAETAGIKDVFESNYQRYQKLGGIINEKDYNATLEKARNLKVLDRTGRYAAQEIKNTIRHGNYIAEFSGIELNTSEDALDSKILLYVILRLDTKPEDTKYHHSQMSDQRIFMEVVRMLGDADSVEKLIEAYPNINFKYEKSE